MNTPVVVVVGSVNVDVVLRVERLPRPGETVTGGTYAYAPGGKGGNQAVAAARLGARTHLIACVGNDDHGRAALADLARENVVTDAVRVVTDLPTGLASVVVDVASENSIAVASGANTALGAGDVETAMARLDGAGVEGAVVLACLEVGDAAVAAAAAGAAARGWPFVLNPAPARPLTAALLALVSVATPNEHEVGELTDSDLSGADALLAAGVGAVVTTLGAQGVRLSRAGSPPQFLRPPPIDATDTTGAGDTFSGALATALASGTEILDAVVWATTAAALSTMAPGARGGMPDRASVEQTTRDGTS